MDTKPMSIKCPNCGAALDIEQSREFIFCTYCGTKIFLYNENEHIYRTIDEAALKHAETEQMIELKRLEILEQRRLERQKNIPRNIRATVILSIIGISMLVGGYAFGDTTGNIAWYLVALFGMFPLIGILYVWRKEEDVDIDLNNTVTVPIEACYYQFKNYKNIEAILKGAGFINVKCTPLNDIKVDVLKRTSMVNSVTINGKNITTLGGKRCSKNANVIITYHSYKN